MLFYLWFLFLRFLDLRHLLTADIVFVEKEFFPYVPLLDIIIFRLFGKKIIVDFDDAVFENYTGGILKVWENNNVPHISWTEIGNVIIFNSDYYHEVTKLVKGTRYVLVCWLTNDNFK